MALGGLGLLVAVLLLANAAQAAHAGGTTFAVSASTRDLDSDGRIDAMDVEFQGAVDATSVRPQDFKVTCSNGRPGCPATTIIHTPYRATVAGNIVQLQFPEHLAMRSDAVPDVTYAAGTMKAGGNPVPAIVAGVTTTASVTTHAHGIPETDGAAPVYWGATTAATKTQIILSFSEPIQPAGAFTTVDPGNVNSLVCYANNSGGGAASLTALTPPFPSSSITVQPNVAVTNGDLGVDEIFPLNFNDAGNCVNNPTTSLRDAAGNGVRDSNKDPSISPSIRYNAVQMTSAVANVGSDKVTLQFNAPVHNGQGASIHESAFQVNLGFSVVGVDHVAGSDTAVLTLSSAIQSTTSLNAITIQVSSGNVIFGPPVSANSLHPLAGASTIGLTDPAAGIACENCPRIVAAKTLDEDKDGWVEQVEVTFSEWVDDTSLAGEWTVFQPGAAAIHPVGVTLSVAAVNTGGGTCGPATTPASPANDNRAYLCLTNTMSLRTGLTSLGPDIFCGTATCPNIYLPGSLPWLTYTGATLADHAGNAVPMTAGFQISDGAPPKLISAHSGDSDGDGKIDSYVLGFSEPLPSVIAADFHLAGRTVSSVLDAIGNNHFGRADTTALNDETTSATADRFVRLTFSEASTFDTNAVPDLVTGTNCCMTADAAGNKLRAVLAGGGAQGVAEQDNAQPILVSVYSQVDVSSIRAVFSEPVAKAGGGALTNSDFAYVSGNGANGATSIAAVSHTAGATEAVLSLNAPVTADDFSKDKLSAFADASPVPPLTAPAPAGASLIRENGGLLRVPVFARPFTVAPDTTAPAAITNFELQKDGQGNPIKGTKDLFVQWIAPGDDGVAGGPVASYSIRATDQPGGVTASNFDSLAQAQVVFDPATLVGPGQIQKATIKGLVPGKLYSIAVKAQDDGLPGSGTSNASPMSAVISATTQEDKIAPGAVNAAASKVKSTTVTLCWTAPADDGTTAGSGAVTGYEFDAREITQASGNQPITAQNFNAQHPGFNPPTLVDGIKAPGEQQCAAFTGLKPETKHSLAARGVDLAGNKGAPGVVEVTTLEPDTVAPAAPSGLTADSITSTGATLTWTAPGDDGTTGDPVGSYIIKVSATQFSSGQFDGLTSVIAVTPPTPVAAGEQQTQVLSGLSASTRYYVGVQAVDDDDTAPKSGVSMVDFTTTATTTTPTPSPTPTTTPTPTPTATPTPPDTNPPPPTGISDAAIAAANGRITLTVETGDDGALVRWTSPSNPPGDIEGFQVFCGTAIIHQTGPSGRSYQDSGTCAAGYRVTAFYADNEGFASNSGDDVPGFADLDAKQAPAAEEDSGLEPWLIWVLGGLALLIVVGLVVLVLVLKGKPAAETAPAWPADEAQTWPEEGETWGEESWGEEWPEGGEWPAEEGAADAEAAEPEGDLPVHDVTCPKCETPFTVEGHKPMQITCPNCQVKGVIR